MQKLFKLCIVTVVNVDLDFVIYAIFLYFRNVERLDDKSFKRIFIDQIDFQKFIFENIEQVNHNVKYLYFVFSKKDVVSDLISNCTILIFSTFDHVWKNHSRV